MEAMSSSRLFVCPSCKVGLRFEMFFWLMHARSVDTLPGVCIDGNWLNGHPETIPGLSSP
jgi:hypothetical protein